MSNVDIAPIERDIANYKADIKLLEALNRLEKNKDFQTIIGKGYLEDEALRLLKLRTDPNTQAEQTQRILQRDLDAISALTSYIRQIRKDAEVATNSLERSEDELEALLAEQQEGI